MNAFYDIINLYAESFAMMIRFAGAAHISAIGVEKLSKASSPKEAVLDQFDTIEAVSGLITDSKRKLK